MSHAGKKRTKNLSEMRSNFGFQKINEDEKQNRVNQVFDNVANKYDIMNDIMSGGMHRAWKEAMVAKITPAKSGQWEMLDMAAGTADVAFRIARKTQNKNAKIVVADINKNMLNEAKKRAEKLKINNIMCVEADAQKLPFGDNQFDVYAISFGIRNVPKIDVALKEAYRVLKPGGKFVCLEFSEIDVPVFDAIYKKWAEVIPQIGGVVTGDKDAYKYLIESIQKFPSAKQFLGAIEQQKFEHAKYQLMSGGIVAIHYAWKI